MNLMAISPSNEYFLFEDKLSKTFKIYKIESIAFEFIEIKSKIFQFVKEYEFDPKTTQLFRYIFLDKDSDDMKMTMDNISHLEIMKHLQICGVIKVNNLGELDITFNNWEMSSNKVTKRSKSTNINVYGSFIKKNIDPLILHPY
jgi:hypothetical protein